MAVCVCGRVCGLGSATVHCVAQTTDVHLAATAATLLSTIAMTDDTGATVRKIATTLVTDECQDLFELKATDVVTYFQTETSTPDASGRVWDGSARSRLEAYLDEQIARLVASVSLCVVVEG